MTPKFDDTSLDATRRTIVLYSTITVVLYHYKPQVDLNKTINQTAFTFENTLIAPPLYGAFLLVCLVYLLARLLAWQPLHESKRNRDFKDFRDTLTVQYQKLENLLEKIRVQFADAQEALNEIDIQSLRDLLSSTLEASQQMQGVCKHLNTANTDLSSVLDRFLVAAKDIQDHRRVYGPTDDPLRMLTEEIAKVRSSIEAVDGGCGELAARTIKEFQRGLFVSDRTESISLPQATKRNLEQANQAWNDAQKALDSFPAHIQHADLRASKISRLELVFFAQAMPIIFISVGCTAATGLLLGYSGWTALFGFSAILAVALTYASQKLSQWMSTM